MVDTNCFKRLGLSLKAKENNEAHNLKVNLTPDLVRSSEYVTLADAKSVIKELKAATSI